MDDGTPSEWDHITQKHWNGLGLTDPIKRIEVHLASRFRFLAPTYNIFSGQMATPSGFP